jgi:F0F1-type ATP synthase epsilon subunit
MALHVELLSDTKKIYSGSASKVILQSETGTIEILPHHAEFVINLVPGYVRVYTDKDIPVKARSGIGVAYKKEENVTILIEEPVQNKLQ